MKYFFSQLLMGVILCVPLSFPLYADQATPEDVALAPYMADLQRYSQKLGYSLRAKNTKLAGFYLHELEELAEDIEKNVVSYDGYPVGKLTGQMLIPSISRLEESIRMGHKAVDLWREYEKLISTCNSCHIATKHEFIVIEPATGVPPYNQRFAVE